MKITRLDAGWNMAATVLRIASGVIVLPLVIRLLPPEEVGLWSIFLSVGALGYLLDFGFGQTFTRNTAYVFSGVEELKPEGYVSVREGSAVNYALLGGLIAAMRSFYRRMALGLLILLLSGGTLYLRAVLRDYQGDHATIYMAWVLYGFLVSYQLMTLYYDALLMGRGYVRRMKQVVILAQLAQIVVVSIALLSGLGLLSMVLGQIVSVVLNRILAHLVFFDVPLQRSLQGKALPVSHILPVITTNAVKVGITSLGAFLVNRSAVFIGSLYLPLSAIGSFGITKQMTDLLAGVSLIWFSTFYPNMIALRVRDDFLSMKRLYIKSRIFFIGFFALGSCVLLLLGNPVLVLLGGHTLFLDMPLFVLLLLVVFLENQHAMAGGVLLTENKVPYFRAAIVSGLMTLGLLFVFLEWTTLGLAGMILAPGFSQAVYQNWKWPLQVKRELKISLREYPETLKRLYRFRKEWFNTGN